MGSRFGVQGSRFRIQMRKISDKIETIMQERSKNRIFSFASVLYPMSFVYGWAVKFREICYEKKILRTRILPCAVISIGNITLGGTGKTPMTIYVTELAKSLGYGVAVISRGYKGGAERTGGIVSDGSKICMDPETAGDEPFMIATKLKNVPVIVGQDRFAGGMLALEKFNPDVLVLDDAFQHLRLARDLNLILLDSRFPFGNTHLLPRGTLREPLTALLRSDAIILTRSDETADTDSILSQLQTQNLIPGRPVFKSVHRHGIQKVIPAKKDMTEGGSQHSSGFSLGCLKGRDVFAFSGIAGNDDFRNTVEGLGCRLKGFRAFPDHHRYSDRDLDAVLRLSQEADADIILTTEKDYVRISERIAWPVDVAVIGLETSLGDNTEAFNRFIKSGLEKRIADI